MINTTLLAEICEAAGAPGHEQRIREIITKIESDYPDDWLIRYELMEILLESRKSKSQIYKNLKSQILQISETNVDLQKSIIRGIQSIEN